ncbi:MAG: MMPL family transporter [Pseudomonadota bacterium]
MNNNNKITISNILGKLAVLIYKKPLTLLIILSLFLGIALYSAKNLKINADLSELLPKDIPSVKELENIKEKLGSLGYVAVVGSQAEPDKLIEFADDFTEKFKKLPNIMYIQTKRPINFFRRYGLYYLEEESLKALTNKVRERKEWETRKANPFFVDLFDDPAPEVDLDKILKGQTTKADVSWFRKQMHDLYHLDKDKKQIVILIRPSAESSDLKFAKKIVTDVENVIFKSDLKKYGENFLVEIGGSYKKKVDQQSQIEKDLGIASVLALLLIIIYLAFHFRRLGAILLVISPLIVGIIWTYGIAAYFFESLNILTAFVSVILLGLGIDHGVHLLGRFEHEWFNFDKDTEKTIRHTYSNTGKAVYIAAITTIIGFAALIVSDFRAFREFGIIAGAGVFCVMLAYLTLLPSLISIFTRLKWKPHKKSDLTNKAPLYAWIIKFPYKTLTITSLILLTPLLLCNKVSFNHDARDMAGNMRSYKLDKTIEQLLGHPQSPIVVFADNEAHEHEIAKVLRNKKLSTGENSTIKFVFSLSDLVPENQEIKRKYIQELRNLLANISLKSLPQKEQDILNAILSENTPEPFELKDLPAEVTRNFRNKEGKLKERLVFIYSAVILDDGRNAIKFQDEISGLKTSNGKTFHAAGPSIIIADIIKMVFKEAPMMALYVFVFVFLSMLIIMKDFKKAAICQFIAVLTLLVSGGLMHLTNVQFNYFNIIIIAVAFGMSVDAAVHIVSRASADGLSPESLSEVARAVTGALLTTALGFGAMKISHHPGMTSLADVALITLSANLILSLVFLPALLKITERKQ